MFCPRCGMVQPDGAGFCTNCGLPFSEFQSEAERAASENRLVPIRSRMKLGPGGHWYLDGVPIDPNAGTSAFTPQTVPLLGVESDMDFDETKRTSGTLAFLEQKMAGASFGQEPPIQVTGDSALAYGGGAPTLAQEPEPETGELFPDEPLDREEVVPYYIIRLTAGVLALAGAAVQIAFCFKMQTFRMLLRLTLDGIRGLPQLLLALVLLIGGGTGIFSRRSESAAITSSVCYLLVAIASFFLSESDSYMLWYLAAFGIAAVGNLSFLIKDYLGYSFLKEAEV